MSKVHLRFTKWGGGAHWHVTLELLGHDRHGEWLGGRTGVTFTRPGSTFQTTGPLVVLVPRDKPWVATFYGGQDFGHLHDCLVYVDMTTPAIWSKQVAGDSGGRDITDALGGQGASEFWDDVTMVDLDLDVFQRHDGSVHVDDEDEFAEHQVELGYPPDIITMAEQSRDEVLSAIRGGIAPFDETTHVLWLAKVV